MRIRIFQAAVLCAACLCTSSLCRPAAAGVSNPDISALGQVLGGWTDDASSPDAEDPALRLGESEFLLEAYLNPYLKGRFTLAGGPEGIGVEEAYASLVKGLPFGLAADAGKFRLPFGKINPTHPHALPFIETPRSVQSLLFGEEGFNETAVQVSDLLPTPGDWASTVIVAVTEGGAFHEGQDGTRLGWLGRWSNGFLLGERGALEAGVSGATGIDDIETDSRAWLAGADLKARFYLQGASQLTLQAEGIYRRSRPDGGDDAAAAAEAADAVEERSGFYVFGDYRWRTQWNGGLHYEQWERAGDAARVDRAFRAFVGYAVLEESTLLRFVWERVAPEAEDAYSTVTLQLLFSMGPHKAHRF